MKQEKNTRNIMIFLLISEIAGMCDLQFKLFDEKRQAKIDFLKKHLFKKIKV